MTAFRALRAASAIAMGVLLAFILLLLGTYAVESRQEPLAALFLVFALFLAVPLAISLGLWIAGLRLQDRAPRASVALVGSSAALGCTTAVVAAAQVVAAFY